MLKARRRAQQTSMSPAESARPAWPWSLGLMVLIALTWELVTRAGLISARVLPSFSATVDAFIQLLTLEFFYSNVASTLKNIGVGLALAILIGFVGAVPLAMWEFLRRSLYPVVVGLDVIPKVTLVPLFVIAFGFGEASKSSSSRRRPSSPSFLQP